MSIAESANNLVLDAASLELLPELERAQAAMRPGRTFSLGGLWGSAQALVLANLVAHSPADSGPWLAIASSDAEADTFAADLRAFGQAADCLPARDGADTIALRARLTLAQRLVGPAENRPRIMVASVLSLLQPLPSPKTMEAEFLRFKVRDVLDPIGLLRHLVKLGYVREPLAEAPGEISLRGDILDVFPFAAEVPLRLELFEDEIESIRTFDPMDQRSIAEHEELEVCLVADSGDVDDVGASPFELLGSHAQVAVVEPLRVDERAELLRIRSPAHERALKDLLTWRQQQPQLALQTLPGDDASIDARSVQGLSVGMQQAAKALSAVVDEGRRVIIACPGEADRVGLMDALSAKGKAPDVEPALGALAKGFRINPWNLVVVTHHELKGIGGMRKRRHSPAHHKVKAIQSFFELKAGDLVVHAVHGLARYRGLVRMTRGTGEEEHLHLAFADDVSLYVPSSRIDMVQRYVGAGSSALSPDRIGGTAFRKRKEKVERGLFDLAADLIEVQAKRALHKRKSWRDDDELVDTMVAEFPYEDTPDQITADLEIQEDLYSNTPMDRMLCGDVGFGKTEMAVRAAFRVVAGGGQVAILVPTTVLAEQHYQTFSERLADFPVHVEVLSRYVTGKRAKAVAEGCAAGEVDVLVGTHRILSKDVKLPKLGLVIIDEEQRFGVTHKEHFKQLRSEVDMLTLTATPIPRTMHMSLSGLRDISALATPPPGRQAIVTKLGYTDDDDLIRDALMHEIGRGGQAFFLHNRVQTIHATAAKLATLVPGLRLAVGHGQMGARELRDVMDSFTRGEADVLLATTIIENGIDISAAGTILIEDADRFGLAELHQLRGRVGRGHQQGHCHLLVERHKPLRDIARQRLKALEELSHLGAGFGISIKDLELRGAGNVLGAEQSGHIAAVGYDMFCRLLKQTIERLQSGESGVVTLGRPEEHDAGVELDVGLKAFLPTDWVERPDTRLEVLRDLAGAHDPAEVDRIGAALRDRFGRLPEPAEGLLRLFRLKTRLDHYRLERVSWIGGAFVIQYADPVAFESLFAGRSRSTGLDLRRIRAGVAHLVPPDPEAGPEPALAWLEQLLPAAGDA